MASRYPDLLEDPYSQQLLEQYNRIVESADMNGCEVSFDSDTAHLPTASGAIDPRLLNSSTTVFDHTQLGSPLGSQPGNNGFVGNNASMYSSPSIGSGATSGFVNTPDTTPGNIMRDTPMQDGSFTDTYVVAPYGLALTTTPRGSTNPSTTLAGRTPETPTRTRRTPKTPNRKHIKGTPSSNPKAVAARNTYEERKTIPCPYCPVMSACLSNHEQHLLTHTGERAYICTIDEKTFARPWGLRRHYKEVHGMDVKVRKLKTTPTRQREQQKLQAQTTVQTAEGGVQMPLPGFDTTPSLRGAPMTPSTTYKPATTPSTTSPTTAMTLDLARYGIDVNDSTTWPVLSIRTRALESTSYSCADCNFSLTFPTAEALQMHRHKTHSAPMSVACSCDVCRQVFAGETWGESTTGHTNGIADGGADLEDPLVLHNEGMKFERQDEAGVITYPGFEDDAFLQTSSGAEDFTNDDVAALAFDQQQDNDFFDRFLM